MSKHDGKDRFTASEDKHGDWLVFDNEDFYCCYGPTNEHDAVSEAIRLNGSKQESELVELRKKNAELEKQVEFEMEQKAKAREQRDKITKSLAIRDLEQQAKGATDICNKALEKLTIPKEMSALRSEYFKAGITALAYAIERESKQLKDGTK